MHFIFSPNFYISQFCLKILNNQNYLTKCCKVSHKFWKNFTKASPVLSTIITSISIQKIFQQANLWKLILQVFLDSPIANFFLARLEVFLHLKTSLLEFFSNWSVYLMAAVIPTCFWLKAKKQKERMPQNLYEFGYIFPLDVFSAFLLLKTALNSKNWRCFFSLYK